MWWKEHKAYQWLFIVQNPPSHLLDLFDCCCHYSHYCCWCYTWWKWSAVLMLSDRDTTLLLLLLLLLLMRNFFFFKRIIAIFINNCTLKNVLKFEYLVYYCGGLVEAFVLSLHSMLFYFLLCWKWDFQRAGQAADQWLFVSSLDPLSVVRGHFFFAMTVVGRVQSITTLYKYFHV